MENKKGSLVLGTGLIGLMFVFLLALAMVPICSAFVGNSTNYNITISNVDYAAYDGHSANYNVDFSLVDQYVGWNESQNYNTTYGFYGGVNFTGYSVGGPFDISIDAIASVQVLAAATATVELTNQNPDFGEDAYLEYWIEDLAGNTMSSGSKTVYVGLLSTVQTEVSLTAPATEGTYVYYARVTWSTIYTAMASDTFTVTAAPSPPPGPGPGPSVPVLRIVDYPVNITVQQDDFAYFVIKVKNIGTVRARNTVLLIEDLSQYWYSVEPQSIDIEANSNESFALKFQIPADAELGSYDFIIKAVSGSTMHEVSSTLNVVSAVLEEIKIIDIQTFPVEQNLRENETGKIQIVVQNTGDDNTSVTLQLSVPDTWEIEQDSVTKTVTMGEQDIFEFTVFPHEAGTFELTIYMTYGDKTETRIIAVVVEPITEEEEYPELPWLFIILVIVAIVLLALELYYSRKKGRRPITERLRHLVQAVQRPAKPAPEHKAKPKPLRKRFELPLRRETAKKVSAFDRLLNKLRRKKK